MDYTRGVYANERKYIGHSIMSHVHSASPDGEVVFFSAVDVSRAS